MAGLIRVVHELRSVIRKTLETERDAELLRRFVDTHDETAFETLVRRHGPMVLGVCLRILGNGHDADDAFQASFLVLARKAETIRSAETVASWLFGVAQRTAVHARRMAARRRRYESQVTPRQERPPAAELREVIDRELARLPDKYRVAVLLCDIEDRSRKEVARELGVAEGTVASRLARGRALLAQKLQKQGILTGTLAYVLGETATANVPRVLIRSAVQNVSNFPANNGAVLSTAVAELATSTARRWTARLAMLAVSTALCAIVVTGTLAASCLWTKSVAIQPSQRNPQATPPDEWAMDFERPDVTDLRRGRWTNLQLPAGTLGAAAAVPVDLGKEGVFFEISMPSTRAPLFKVNPDSHLHVTYCMGKPDWMNIFLIACREDGEHSSNYLFNELAFEPPAPDQWRTVTIPLNAFKRIYADGVEPWRAEYPHLVMFSAPYRDRELVIDRIWVTRGGPGAVQYKHADNEAQP